MIINYREIEQNDYGFPPWLMKKLGDCPSAGEGVHTWIYRVALSLRHYVEMEEAVEIIKENMTREENPAGEVYRSVLNAYEAEYYGLPDEAYRSADPEKNPVEVGRIFQSFTAPLKILKSASNPIPDLPTILNRLYLDEHYICIGNAIIDKRGKKCGYSSSTLQKKWLVQAEDLHSFAQIVPNPMRKGWGLTQSGDPSERSKDNAAIDRIYAVQDFDFTLEGAFGGIIEVFMYKLKLMPRETIHEITAALILHIAICSPNVPLIMVVDSGGKSLHAWWDIRHMSYEEQREWFMRWVPLGADPAIFKTNNQFVRMPWGTREVHKLEQPVIYWGL